MNDSPRSHTDPKALSSRRPPLTGRLKIGLLCALVSLSMVGFGEDGQTAVVYASSSIGWRGGGGDYLLLVLEAGEWKVIDSVNVWKAV